MDDVAQHPNNYAEAVALSPGFWGQKHRATRVEQRKIPAPCVLQQDLHWGYDVSHRS